MRHPLGHRDRQVLRGPGIPTRRDVLEPALVLDAVGRQPLRPGGVQEPRHVVEGEEVADQAAELLAGRRPRAAPTRPAIGASHAGGRTGRARRVGSGRPDPSPGSSSWSSQIEVRWRKDRGSGVRG